MCRSVWLTGSVFVLLGVALMLGAAGCAQDEWTCPVCPRNGETKVVCPSDAGVCPADGATEAPKDIVQVAQDAGQYSTLIKALDAAGMTDVLKGVGPYTVFAPTDEAFKKLPEGVLDNLLKPECKSDLRMLLNYHVVSGRVRAGDIQRVTKCDTLSGEAFKVSRQNGNIFIDNAKVIQADIDAGNGLIHSVDQVLIPCDLAKRLRQLSKREMREEEQRDRGTEEMTRGEARNILQLAQESEELSTFIKALKAADMLDTFKEAGPFTVFAPTNEAWEKMSESQFNDLFKPENKAQLTRILKMHVIKGDQLSQDQISKQGSISPVGERMMTVHVRDKFVTIDEDQASITKPDIQASNGVIHEIDTVIMP